MALPRVVPIVRVVRGDSTGASHLAWATRTDRGRGLALGRDRARAEGVRWRETMRRRREIVVVNAFHVELASDGVEQTRAGGGRRRTSWMMRGVVKALGLGLCERASGEDVWRR
jgi:hypothetical protein